MVPEIKRSEGVYIEEQMGPIEICRVGKGRVHVLVKAQQEVI